LIVPLEADLQLGILPSISVCDVGPNEVSLYGRCCKSSEKVEALYKGHIEAIDSAGVEYRIDRDSTNDGKPVCKLHAEQSKKYKSITLDEVALY
jgi:hypothetical protein